MFTLLFKSHRFNLPVYIAFITHGTDPSCSSAEIISQTNLLYF